MPDQPDNHIRVHLRRIETEVRLGLHPWERHPEKPTRLLIDVELQARLAAGPLTGQSFIDYDRVREAVKAWPARPHTDLLETLADDLARLCFADPQVEACRIGVFKPDVFNEVGEAGIEVTRTRAGFFGAPGPGTPSPGTP